MKKILCTLLATMLLLAGCSETKKPASTDAPKGNETVEESKYTIYCGVAESVSDLREAVADTSQVSVADYGDLSKLDFDYNDSTEMTNEEAEPTKLFSIDGQEYELAYKGSFSSPLANSANESLTEKGLIDEYVLEGKIRVRYRQKSGELESVLVFDNRAVEGDFTEEEAKERADALLAEDCGEALSAQYTSEVLASNDSLNKVIGVLYTRYICGYETSDRVYYNFNLRGDLVDFSATQFGIFDSIESELTLEKIQSAENVLLNTISDQYVISSKVLELEAGGTPYLHVYASYPLANGEFDPVEFFINIE